MVWTEEIEKKEAIGIKVSFKYKKNNPLFDCRNVIKAYNLSFYG
jgi:hypothetical protein